MLYLIAQRSYRKRGDLRGVRLHHSRRYLIHQVLGKQNEWADHEQASKNARAILGNIDLTEIKREHVLTLLYSRRRKRHIAALRYILALLCTSFVIKYALPSLQYFSEHSQRFLAVRVLQQSI